MAGTEQKKSFDSNRLKWIRKVKRITNNDLAGYVDRSEDFIKGAIRDKKILPDLLDTLAERLGVSVDYLKGIQSISASDKNKEYYFSVFGKEPLIDPDGIIVLPYNRHSSQDSEKNLTDRKKMLTEYLVLLGERGIQGFYDDGDENAHKWIIDGHMYNFSFEKAEELVYSDPHFEFELIKFVSQYISKNYDYFGHRLPDKEFKIIE